VGAGLLAKTTVQSTLMSPDTPPSRASPLPQFPHLAAFSANPLSAPDKFRLQAIRYIFRYIAFHLACHGAVS